MSKTSYSDLDTRALHQHREQSPWGITCQVDATFSLNELLVDSLTSIKVVVDTEEGVSVLGVYGLLQVITPAVPLSQGKAVCPTSSVATGTGIQGKSVGLPRVRVAWAVVTADVLFLVLYRGHWVLCIYFWDYGIDDPLFRFSHPA